MPTIEEKSNALVKILLVQDETIEGFYNKDLIILKQPLVTDLSIISRSYSKEHKRVEFL